MSMCAVYIKHDDEWDTLNPKPCKKPIQRWQYQQRSNGCYHDCTVLTLVATKHCQISSNISRKTRKYAKLYSILWEQ